MTDQEFDTLADERDDRLADRLLAQEMDDLELPERE